MSQGDDVYTPGHSLEACYLDHSGTCIFCGRRQSKQGKDILPVKKAPTERDIDTAINSFIMQYSQRLKITNHKNIEAVATLKQAIQAHYAKKYKKLIEEAKPDSSYFDGNVADYEYGIDQYEANLLKGVNNG